jgi:DNA (cytosine-5)-methyltransferase 1
MTHGSLFSGIGGFELGAQMAGIETLWNCEIEPYNRKVLAKHFPDSKQYEDITTLSNPEPVTIISGGFPCQDISIAGNRKGIQGERSGLWKQYARIIREIRPSYIIAENSPALISSGFEHVLCDLSSLGYDAEWQCLSATQFGAPHRRERIYVIAYSREMGRKGNRVFNSASFSSWFKNPDIRSQDWSGFIQGHSGAFYSAWNGGYQEGNFKSWLHRVDDGLSKRLYTNRVASLGNAVIPKIAHYLFECIKQHAA